MSAFETISVTYDHDDSIAHVTLERPEKRNAFNDQMIAELQQAFTDLAANNSLRAIVLQGTGKVFSAGADLDWMRSMAAADQETNFQDSLKLARLLRTIDESPHCVIAKIQGAALGGGMGLACVCDIVLADEKAQFGFTEVRLGLIPAVISPYILRKVGASWTRRYFLTGELFNTERALLMGLVHESAVLSELDGALENILHQVLAASPQAITASKDLVKLYFKESWQKLPEATAARIAEQRVSPAGQEGMAAFLEKRPPKWKPDS